MARKKSVKNPIAKVTAKAKEESPEAKEVRGWLDKVEAAIEVKKNWREKFRCAMAYDYLDGAQRPNEIPEEEWITVNRIYSNLLAELPLLYSTDPYFYVKLARSFNTDPMKIPLYEMKGRVRQSMLNYLKKEIELKNTVRVNIVDAYFQYGVAKTHSLADFVDNPDKGQQTKDDNGVGLVGDDGQPVMEPDKLPVGEAYSTTRVDPDNFGWDSDAGPLPPSWTFLWERIVRPLDEVKNDERFGEARKDITATEVSEDEVQKERERRKGKEGLAKGGPSQVAPTLAVYYEVYNLRKKEWFIVSPGLQKAYLRKPERIPKGIEKHPYSILRFAPLRKDSPYPIPPVSQWLDPQKETNLLRSKILTHRKRFNRKYVLYREAFDDADAAADKLEVGDDGTVIIASASQGQPVFPVQDAQLDQNHIQELVMLRGDFEELAVGSNQRGMGAGVDSATEAGIIEKRVSLREGDKLGQTMDFITDIGRKLDQLVQANITRDQAVKVNGPEGEFWELVRADSYEEIEGEFEYGVNVGATTPQLPEIERAQWLAFLGLLANAPQLMLSKSLMKKMAELHHIEDEMMLQELYQIAKQMMGGQLPMPGAQGSQPNTADAMTRTRSVAGGMAAGMNNVRGGQ